MSANSHQASDYLLVGETKNYLHSLRVWNFLGDIIITLKAEKNNNTSSVRLNNKVEMYRVQEKRNKSNTGSMKNSHVNKF